MSTSRIDVHAHYLPEFYREALLNASIDRPDGMPAVPRWSEQMALDAMARLDIRTAFLSISSPGVHFGDDRAAKDLARRVNEEGARIKEAHPKRFGFFGSTPLPDIEGAMDEAIYALDKLGADGIVIETSYEGMYLGDARLEPFYEALNDRKAVLFLHPTTGPCPDLAFGFPRPMVEFLFETTRTVINMLLSGVTQRYPDIRVIVPHAGAALSVVASRVELFAQMLPPTSRNPFPSISAELRKLYYDLAGAPLPVLLKALLEIAAPERIFYGSDWPFTPLEACVALASQLDESPEVHSRFADMCMRRNAEVLWPHLS